MLMALLIGMVVKRNHDHVRADDHDNNHAAHAGGHGRHDDGDDADKSADPNNCDRP